MKLVAPLFFLILFSCVTESDDDSLSSEDDLEKQKKTLQAMEEKGTPGDEGEIDDQGLRQGLWITYGKDDAAMGYPDQGKIKEGRYVNDMLEGYWTYYNMNGAIDSVVYYIKGIPAEQPLNALDTNGEKTGYWIVYGKDVPKSGYGKNAIIEEGYYTQGIKRDFWIYYNSKGDVDSVGTYWNWEPFERTASNQTDARGFRQGHWCIYGQDNPEMGYPANAKLEEGNYDFSRKTGRWIYYAPDQTTDSVVRYVNGNRFTVAY